jgi:hypothetical protein
MITSKQDKNEDFGVLGQTIQKALEKNGVVILPPMDVIDSITLVTGLGINSQCVIIDPWYNKGFGGESKDYNNFISNVLTLASNITDHIYLWGFPEIVAQFVNKIPEGFKFVAWLTWYYKNCPSVIRGWRSAQNACIHMSKLKAKIYPEHFLNEEQLEKMKLGKMRFIPGPPSVIEEPLNIGFVGKKEQTGHPSQKPEKVYERLILMASKENDLIFDPMAGSGTTGSVTQKFNRRAILCDMSEDYTKIMEKRLGIKRIELPESTGYKINVG